MRKPLANQLNRNIDFTALTGHKADLIRTSGPFESRTRAHCPIKRRRILSGSEEPTQPSQTADRDQTGTSGKTPMRPSPHRSALPISLIVNPTTSAESGHPQNLTSNFNSPSKAIRSDQHPILITDDSDTGEKQREPAPKTHTSSKAITSPNSSPQDKPARIDDEPLTPDIISRIKLRVKADDPGVSARGPILVDFEVYKTSERLFTSLMSERSLKPEMQKRVSQLTATIRGKETCCRRDRLGDWVEVCRELRELWDINPELFDRRFEVDVMLHVDE